jgi:hypothetical protein
MIAMIWLLFGVMIVIELIMFYEYTDIKFLFRYLFLFFNQSLDDLIFEVKIRYWYLKKRFKR